MKSIGARLFESQPIYLNTILKRGITKPQAKAMRLALEILKDGGLTARKSIKDFAWKALAGHQATKAHKADLAKYLGKGHFVLNRYK